MPDWSQWATWYHFKYWLRWACADTLVRGAEVSKRVWFGDEGTDSEYLHSWDGIFYIFDEGSKTHHI
jgi:hypothetical protein